MTESSKYSGAQNKKISTRVLQYFHKYMHTDVVDLKARRSKEKRLREDKRNYEIPQVLQWWISKFEATYTFSCLVKGIDFSSFEALMKQCFWYALFIFIFLLKSASDMMWIWVNGQFNEYLKHNFYPEKSDIF